MWSFSYRFYFIIIFCWSAVKNRAHPSWIKQKGSFVKVRECVGGGGGRGPGRQNLVVMQRDGAKSHAQGCLQDTMPLTLQK